MARRKVKEAAPMSIAGTPKMATSPRKVVREASLWQRMWQARLLYLLVIPTFAFVLAFSYVPAFSAIYHSFTLWSGGPARWIGLQNFKRLLTDPYLNASWLNMVKLTVFNLCVMVIPLVNAVAIFRLTSPGWQYRFRVLFILPAIVPGVVGALLWVNFLGLNGLFNQLLRGMGLGAIARPWLGSFDFALYALMFVGFPWPGGTTILFYLAGLMNIPRELIDAATVDGVNGWERFIHLELPLVMGQVKLFLVLTVIGNIQGFAGPLIMTQGGPGFATLVPGLHMFNAATQRQQMGYASAIGTVLFVLIFGLTFLNMRYIRSTIEITS
jgi:raffinose/stachyose/melibiose transport system permease protein